MLKGYLNTVSVAGETFIPINPANFSNKPIIDGFGRVRTSNPVTVLDVNFMSDKQFGIMLENGITASATTTLQPGYIDMDITAANQNLIRQTRRYLVYQPGKSFLFYLTGQLASATGGSSRIGAFDNDNGFYFELTSSGIQVVKRSNVTGSVVESSVAQASWNIDTLDGSDDVNNPSGLTLNTTGSNIFFIEQEWLGVGAVSMGFILSDRSMIYCHRFNHAGDAAGTPYTARASLPIRYQLITDGTFSGSIKMRQICSTCISEGGYNPLGRKFAIARPTTKNFKRNSGELPLLAIRAKSSRNKVTLIPRIFTIAHTDTNVIYISRLYLLHGENAASKLSGESFVAHPSTQSAVEYDVSANSVSGLSGVSDVALIESITSTEESSAVNYDLNQMVFTGVAFNGSTDILLITGEIIDGTGNDVTVALSWREIE